MTLLCASINVASVQQTQRDAVVAAEHGADLLELRIDSFAEPDQVRHLVENAPLPCIVTCRSVEEGGRSELGDEERIDVLKQIENAAYIDVELSTQRRIPDLVAGLPQRVILSTHDFVGRPDKMHNLMQELHSAPAAVSKIAYAARSIRDCFEVFELLQERPRPCIALCMGEAGLISRVLAKKFASMLTFCSVDPEGETAPGQVTLRDMRSLYRWDAMKPSTKVYGVVAEPVKHSMSPAIHNGAFTETGYDGVYLPLLVQGSYESFKAFMETGLHCDGLDLSGLSITLPHKTHALRYLQEKEAAIEPLALSIGAVNTIAIDRDPAAPGGVSLRGLNTDYAAILDSITAALAITRDDLAGRRVAVIGAGGTGRTAVAALAHYNATVVVYNRTHEKAEALANEFNGQTGKVVAARMEKLCDSCCEIFINTTSVGMYPNVDDSPVAASTPTFSSDTLVFDTVYNPIETKLLREAKDAGARTISGVEMFVRQAARQFETWTNLEAPMQLMRDVVVGRLTGLRFDD